MDELAVSTTILRLLHPHWMASISLLLSGIYIFKYICVNDKCGRDRNPIYILRAFLWGVWAVVWASFPYVDIIVGRSMLRAMIAIIMTVEIAYNILYIKDAFTGVWLWILKR